MSKQVLVKFAADCPPCLDCGEPYCTDCDEHYADCSCVGPTQEGYEYEEVGGVLLAREIEV